MEISRNNYQVWISDYYDGSLSDSECTMLLNFLKLNPGLMDEFNSYQDLTLYPDISIRMDKELIRKDLQDEDPDLIEHCALALSEGDLSPEISMEFSELLERSAYARTESNIFNSLKLAPGDNIYPDKLKLKRIPLRAGFVKNAVRLMAVAAAAALIVSLSILLPRQTENSFTYNSAYLLPFNSGKPAASEVAGLTPLLNAGRLTVKEIRFTERTSQEASIEEQAKRNVIIISESPFLDDISLLSESNPENLVAMALAQPVVDEYPSRALSPRQFLAMNFRKHLLKEDISSTDKLKVHEVADVSIDGLNKLLGWEMQFEKEKAEDGKLESFIFTSQLLKLDHKKKKVTD